MRAYLYGSLALAVGFIVLPLAALFLQLVPADLLGQLGSHEVRAALLVSLETSLVALGVVVVLGTPVAYLLATRQFPGRGALTTLFELPLVLPPAVAGTALLAAFGSAGLLGDELSALGIELKLTKAAVVLAIAFVASPLYIRQAQTAFAAIDRRLVESGRALGGSPWRNFVAVELPLAADGISAGAAMAWARGLGEFGATMLFAGSLEGVTQNLTLTIYAELDRDFGVSIALAALLVAISLIVLAVARLFQGGSSARPGTGARALARLSARGARRAATPPRAGEPARAPRSTLRRPARSPGG